jgi:tetratricopeptide (TPR) repeat protein
MTLSTPLNVQLDELWDVVRSLIDQGRDRDALVTLRAVAERTDLLAVRITLGTLLAESGELHAAVCEWTRVIDLAQAAGDRAALAAVYHNLAAVYREWGDWELARRFQQRSLQFRDDCDAADLLQLANDAFVGRRWDLAETLLATAEKLPADPVEHAELQGHIAATRGLIQGGHGRPHAGLRELRQVYHRHQQAGDDRLAGRDLLNLAVLFEQQSRYGLALHSVHAANRHLRAAQDTCGLNRARYLQRRFERQQATTRQSARWN